MAEGQQRFNLATMSGIFPGTHTMVFQRVRLSLADGGSTAPRWARLQWYTTPPACVLTLPETVPESLTPAEPSAEQADQPALSDQLHFAEPLQGDFRRTLRTALRQRNYRLRACGSCAHWRPQTNAATADGISLGCCAWCSNQSTLGREIPPALALQSMLAVDCRHWQFDGFRPDDAEPAPAVPGAPSSPPPPVPRRAEQESNERWTLWGQVRRLLAGAQSTPTPPPSTTERPWAEIVVERSGVGAGTEQCHACNGRIANLGALTVATGEGDKQTFSVWRCRRCYTFYLNDWIDRWERTDSLETEETYFRLAPAEALEVLAVIDNIVDAEHPARRHERQAQRSWMLGFLAGHLPLSHQVRQGR